MSDIRPEYKTPEVVTYSDSDILKQMPVKGIGRGPQDFLGTSAIDSGKRSGRYRGISTRSLLEGSDE